jgi:hypothetical protein
MLFIFSSARHHRHKNTHNEVVHQPSIGAKNYFFHNAPPFAFKKAYRHSARPVK